jgi:beta-carotene 3-hydroxylase
MVGMMWGVRVLLDCLIFSTVLGAMEGFAWTMHRYVMHGILWCWHKSHHQPRSGRYERNDLFALLFSIPAVAAFALGASGNREWTAIALGITGYGIVYALFHDGLVHRRFPTGINPQSTFWKPRVQAHRVHHAIRTKNGCVSFGFIFVEPIGTLKHKLAEQRSSMKIRA